jgi:F-type H+-transporting ATPase subunit delta
MSALADGYAAAFLEVARAEGALGTVGNELASFAGAFEGSPQLQSALTDTFLPVERRQTVVAELLGSKASPVTTNLLSMLVGAGRAKDIPAVASAFLSKAASEQGRVSGEVRSAHPLSLDQQGALTAAIEKSTGKKVALTFLVDPSVLGGVVTTIGDTVIDGSIRNRLDQLKAAL